MEAALEKGKFGRTKAYELINDSKIVACKIDHNQCRRRQHRRLSRVETD
jgi:hypothetical protein